MKVSRSAIAEVVEACLEGGAHSSTRFLAPDSIVRCTRIRKPSKRDLSTTLVLTIGRPNYSERQIIKRTQRQRKGWPKPWTRITEYRHKNTG